MHPEWEGFLREMGARLRAAQVEGFDNDDLEIEATARGDVLADLSQLSLVAVRGPDAATFLQGQLTNDLARIDATHSQLSAYCTPQGRVLAVLRVFVRDDTFLLQLPAVLRDDISARLQRYVLRARVALASADHELQRIGLSGQQAPVLLRAQLGEPPDEVNGCSTGGELQALRLPGPLPRFEIIGPWAALRALWRRLASDARPVGASRWAWLDIMAGIPTVYPQTSEAFIPQTLNLDLLDAVSFTKGCYAGQEIVARMHYRSRPKQRMVRAHVGPGAAPGVGDAVFAPALGEQAVGTVVEAQCSPRPGYDLLAVVATGRVRAGELRLGAVAGRALVLEPLPYPLTSDA